MLDTYCDYIEITGEKNNPVAHTVVNCIKVRVKISCRVRVRFT